jgi:hypothetical protein
LNVQRLSIDLEPRTAVHEAGHVLAAWSSTAVVRLDHAEVSPVGGHVVSGYAVEAGLWPRLVITLAGVAAESLRYQGGRLRPSAYDLLLAHEMATVLAASGEPPPWSEPAEPSLAFDSFYSHAITPDEARILSSAYKMARHVVRRHGAQLERVARLLTERGRVGERELEEVLPPRAGIRLLGLLDRGKFLMPKEEKAPAQEPLGAPPATRTDPQQRHRRIGLACLAAFVGLETPVLITHYGWVAGFGGALVVLLVPLAVYRLLESALR